MNWQTLINQTFVENIGWTLLHSIWQISLAALLLFNALRILKNVSANLRYLVCVAALFAALFSPILTFISFSNSSPNKVGNGLERVETSFLPNPNILRNNQKITGEVAQTGETEKIERNHSIGIFENLKIQLFNIFTNLIPYFVCAWILGILGFAFRFGGGIWQTHKLKTTQISVPEEKWTTKFEELCEQIRINFKVNFLQSELIETPMVIGWLKPFVIVPSSVLLGLNPRELETIIAHELIHIRRHDYLVNILQSFVEIVLFFHPLSWWISAQVRGERENACDDEVLRMFVNEPLLYANALANLEEYRFQSANVLPSNALAANGGNLMFRIQRIIKNAAGIQNSKGSVWSSGLAFLLAFVISVIMFSASLYGGFNSSNKEVTTRLDSKRVAIALYSNSQYLIIEDVKDADESISLLTENLKRNRIPVVGYVAYSGNVKVDDKKARDEKIAELWRNAGFEIGWSSLKFPKSFNSTLADYARMNEKRPSFGSSKRFVSILEKIKEQIGYNKPLSEPPTEEEKKKIRKAMTDISKEDMEKERKAMTDFVESRQAEEQKWNRENNLKSASFTINSVDWMYSNIYDSARNSNDKKLMKYVQDNYLEYLSKIFDYYENLSQQKYNRKIPQTFGLEPSRLTADSIDRIVEMLKKRGYEFISMDDALTDEAFLTRNNYGFGGRSSFLESYPFPNKGDLTDKPKPHEDIMTRWYEKDSKK